MKHLPFFILFIVLVCGQAGAKGLQFEKSVLKLPKSLEEVFKKNVKAFREDEKNGLVYVDFDFNKDGKVDMESTYRDGKLVQQKIDHNGDGKFDSFKENNPSADIIRKEMKDNNFDDKIDWIRIITREPGKEYIVVVSTQIDKDYDGRFETVDTRRTSLLQKMTENNCFMNGVVPVASDLPDDVKEVIADLEKTEKYNRFRAGNNAVIKIDKKCNRMYTAPPFAAIVGRSISTGIACLNRLATTSQADTDPDRPGIQGVSMAQVNTMNGLALLHGKKLFQTERGGLLNNRNNKPRKVNEDVDSNLTFVCTKPDDETRENLFTSEDDSTCNDDLGAEAQGFVNKMQMTGTEAVGFASIGAADNGKLNYKCGGTKHALKHPFIYLDDSRYDDVPGNRAELARRGQRLMERTFHEFMHNLGFSHKMDIDYAEYCGKCCMDENYRTNAEKRIEKELKSFADQYKGRNNTRLSESAVIELQRKYGQSALDQLRKEAQKDADGVTRYIEGQAKELAKTNSAACNICRGTYTADTQENYKKDLIEFKRENYPSYTEVQAQSEGGLEYQCWQRMKDRKK